MKKREQGITRWMNDTGVWEERRWKRSLVSRCFNSGGEAFFLVQIHKRGFRAALAVWCPPLFIFSFNGQDRGDEESQKRTDEVVQAKRYLFCHELNQFGYWKMLGMEGKSGEWGMRPLPWPDLKEEKWYHPKGWLRCHDLLFFIEGRGKKGRTKANANEKSKQ